MKWNFFPLFQVLLLPFFSKERASLVVFEKYTWEYFQKYLRAYWTGQSQTGLIYPPVVLTQGCRLKSRVFQSMHNFSDKLPSESNRVVTNIISSTFFLNINIKKNLINIIMTQGDINCGAYFQTDFILNYFKFPQNFSNFLSNSPFPPSPAGRQ